jgi:hypothetical protein
MSKRRKKKKKQPVDPYDVLEGRIKITSYELIRLIHRVNPTKESLEAKKEAERYKLKARLQSLLIRQFYDGLLVEQPDPGNPQVVSLDLRYFDEDACHALIPELDPDARSWVQSQIDEAASKWDTEANGILPTNPDQQSFDTRAAFQDVHQKDTFAVKEEYSQKELINRGRQALEEYDYIACEDYFYRAFQISRGGIEATLTILEFFVDHLADYEKALALEAALPASTKKNEDVKVLLALAAARFGNFNHALDFLGLMLHPRAPEVYLLGAKYFVAQGNIDRAKELQAVLKSFELDELKSEINQLETDIHKLSIKNLEPVEQKMRFAWQQGEKEMAVKLAEQLLVQWPENKEARRILSRFSEQQRTDKIESLLRQADEADSKARFREEVELLKRIMALGKGSDDLRKRFERVQREAKLQREEAEIAETIKLWTAGRKKETLLRYVKLSEKQRSEIMNRNQDPHFPWLSQVISCHMSIKPEKMVEAVLALGESNEILQKGGDPRPVVSAIEAHGKILRAVPAANDILHRAERMAKTLESANAKELLQKARDLVADEDYHSAREYMDQIKVDLLNEEDRKILTGINAKLKRFEPIQAMEQKYISEADHGNHFSSRDIALDLAEIVEPDTALHWRQKAAFHSAQIKKEWSLVTGNIEALPPCYSSHHLLWSSEEFNSCLLPDGRHITLVSSHDCWVFLRTFCIEEQKYNKGIMFRAPAPIPFPCIYIAGNEIWVTGNQGHAIALSLEPIEILSWHDFSEFVKEDNIVEHVWLFPKCGYLWLETRDTEIRADEVCEVINIEDRRVERRFKMKGHPIIINTGGGYRIVIQDYISRSVQVVSEQGKTITTFSFAPNKLVHAAALHPNGVDYLFLPFQDPGDSGYFEEFAPNDEYEDEEDFLLIIEKVPDVEGTYTPVVIEDSHGELIHCIHTALDDGLIFVYFGDGNFKEPSYQLAAFTSTEHGLEKLYQVEVPDKLILVTDQLSRKVVALHPGDRGSTAVILGRDKPVLAHKTVDLGFKLSLPSFKGIMTCDIPTGAMNATSLAFMSQIRTCSADEFDALVLEMNHPDEKDPDKIAAFIYALERMMYNELAGEMRARIRKIHPDHPMVLMESATEAIQERKWQKVISLLEGVSPVGLNEGTACHICHLLGMALFAEGDIKGALETWQKGAAYENIRCDLAPYITYAEISLMSPKRIKNISANNNISRTLRTLSVFETVDAHLLNKEWRDAISIMEKYNVQSSSDIQLLARFTEAFLHQRVTPGELQWFCKVVVLANYCENHSDRYMSNNPVLPPQIESWSDQRLDDLASRAAEWLNRQPTL